MKVAFICVNYNNSQVTIKYILNVLSIKYEHDVRIIVVDNDSAPADIRSLEVFVAGYKEVILIKSNQNRGYFSGLNIGIEKALEEGYCSYQIVGNNDLQFPLDFLAHLQALKLEPDELVVAPDVVTSHGFHENPHVVNRISIWRKYIYEIYFSHYFIARIITLLYSDQRKPKAFDPVRKHIYMGIGAVYVLTPHFFRHFSMLWDLLFLYGEEAVLGGQVASVGGKMLYEPTLKCNHEESATTSRLGFKKRYIAMRDSYKIYKKYL